MRVLFLALLLSTSVQAADFSGRTKLDAIGYDAGAVTAESALGYENSSELAGQVRLELNQSLQRWNFQAAWQLDARQGSAVEREHAIAAAYPALAESSTDTSYWDLQDSVSDDKNHYSSQRLDRLNLGYSSNTLVMRLGRQALTWPAARCSIPWIWSIHSSRWPPTPPTSAAPKWPICNGCCRTVPISSW